STATTGVVSAQSKSFRRTPGQRWVPTGLRFPSRPHCNECESGTHWQGRSGADPGTLSALRESGRALLVLRPQRLLVELSDACAFKRVDKQHVLRYGELR